MMHNALKSAMTELAAEIATLATDIKNADLDDISEVNELVVKFEELRDIFNEHFTTLEDHLETLNEDEDDDDNEADEISKE